MRRVMIVLAALTGALAGAPALAKPLPIPPPVSVPALPPGADVQPFAFKRLVIRLAPGEKWGERQSGGACQGRRDLIWEGGSEDLNTELLEPVFHREAAQAGFKTEGDPDNLFERSSSSAEYAVGGFVRSVDARVCYPYAVNDNLTTSKGEALIEMEWQVYSRLERKVVARIETRGGMALKKEGAGNADKVIHGAFVENVKALLSSEEFRKVLLGGPRVGAPGGPVETAQAARTEPQPLLRLAVNKAAKPGGISAALSSVVVILAGDGHGSGFLVSTEGHVITAQHVVGGARYVKLRWSDGTETLGEVLRTDRVRDVALIKSDIKGRTPLAFRSAPMAPGETVIAVGAPAYEDLQGTVTRGVVSALRTLDRLPYIQSDVTVSKGNSGGPLLDEQGRVVGICNLGIQPEGVPIGINLFTPIADAARSLSVEQ